MIFFYPIATRLAKKKPYNVTDLHRTIAKQRTIINVARIHKKGEKHSNPTEGYGRDF